MKARLLSLFAMVMTAIGMQAQWTAPEPPTTASDPVSGHVYQVKNVEAQWFLSGGASFFSWATTAVLVDPESEDPIRFTLTEEFNEDGTSKGWTFKGYDGNWPDNYVFVSGNGIEGFAMHVDNATDVHRYFELLKQDNGTYRIRVAAADDTYGAKVEGWADKCWGWQGWEGEYMNAIYASVKPEDGYFCDWEFYDFSLYSAKQTLYNLSLEAEEYEVDYTPYAEAYNGSDMEAVNQAIDQLRTAIAHKKVDLFLTGATEDDPRDGTPLLTNPSFDEGNLNGWNKADGSATPAVAIWSAQSTNTIGTMAGLGSDDWGSNCEVYMAKFDIYQKLDYMPAGIYKFTCQGFWRTQGENVPAQLYAILPDGTEQVAELANVSDYATEEQLFAYGDPNWGDDQLRSSGLYEPNCMSGAMFHFHHYTGDSEEPDYTSTLRIRLDEPVENLIIGVRTTSANTWVIFDNFTLTYYGNVSDPDRMELQELIAKTEARYPEIDDVKANKGVKDNYSATLAEAKGQYENSTEMLAKMKDAIEKLEASIAAYKTLYALIETWNQKTASIEGTKWATANDAIYDKVNEMLDAYDECSYTDEDIAAAEQSLSNMFADAIGAAVEKGDDLTFLLNNPDFVTDFSGWVVSDEEGCVTPAHGGINIAIPEDHVRYEELYPFLNEEGLLNNGNAEVYHAKFDVNQTIVNMPAGIFTLSCQAFERDDNGAGMDAELYAILPDGSEQTVKVKDLHSEYSVDQLYDGSYGGDQYKLSDSSYGSGYVPNGMEGANVYFKLGYYKNYFDIDMTERGNLTVGIRTASAGDWVLFDDFKIVYKGDDGSAYQGTIERLMGEAQAVLDNEESYLTAEAENAITESLNAGDEALADIEDITKEDALAVVEQLTAAIEVARQSNLLAAELEHDFQILEETRVPAVSSSDTSLSALMNDVADKLFSAHGFATNAEIEQAIVDLKKGYTVYVQCDFLDATEDEPADITAVIYNTECEDYDGTAGIQGWTSTVAPGVSDGVAEVFNTNFTLSQTIYGLAPGFYRLGVQAFNRYGGYANVETCLNTDSLEERSLAYLYAGADSTRLLPISADMAAYTEYVTEGAEITVAEVPYYVPNNMAQAAAAFENELYKNILQFEVKEGQQSVTIGIQKAENITDAWTIWDKWTLLYLGTAQPTENPTTSIMAVENAANAQLVIYNLAGQRVAKAQKGIYIVNGRKVVVK